MGRLASVGERDDILNEHSKMSSQCDLTASSLGQRRVQFILSRRRSGI